MTTGSALSGAGSVFPLPCDVAWQVHAGFGLVMGSPDGLDFAVSLLWSAVPGGVRGARQGSHPSPRLCFAVYRRWVPADGGHFA